MNTDSGRVGSAETGSRPTGQAASRLDASRFDPARIASLSRDQIDLLAMCPTGQSFVAADIPWSRPGPTGNALNRLAERGLLIQASDPEKWGRSRYIADPTVVAIAMEARQGRDAQRLDGEAATARAEGIAQGQSPLPPHP